MQDRKEAKEQLLHKLAELRQEFAALESSPVGQEPGEETLRASEERFESLAAASFEGVVLTEVGRCVDANQQLAQMLGYSREELIGMDMRLLAVPKDAERIVRNSHAGVDTITEYGVVRKDGKIINVEVHGRLLSRQGRALRMTIVRDITERKRAEETLRQSRDQLVKLADNLPHSIVYQITHDAAGNRRFLYVSAAAERILGIKPEEAATDPFVLYRRILEPFQPLVQQAEIASAMNQSLFDVEVPIRVADGAIRWLHICSMPSPGEDGNTVWNGIATDITDHKRAEEALATAASRWSVTFDAMADGVSVHGPDHTLINVNESLCRMLGKDRSELIGKKCYQVFHGKDAPIPSCPIERARLTFRKEDAEYFEPTLDRWLAASASPVLDDAGCLLHLVHTIRDITDRKQAQELLEKSYDEELQRHRDELTHVTRLSMMGEMAAGLVHELNQPLHAVKSYARGSVLRLLKMPQPDEELLAALRQIGEEADRAAEIIRRVRRFVQKRDLHSSNVLVNQLVEEVVLLGKAELEERHAEVVLTLADDLPAVMADPIQIEQVLMNLVRNGLEAMNETPDDDRLLVIKTMRHGRDAVHVEVGDCGKGIDPGHWEQVFEPFFTTKPDGMGMGLAISRSIVQAYGGHLWASANPLRGCTFHFTLPISKVD